MLLKMQLSPSRYFQNFPNLEPFSTWPMLRGLQYSNTIMQEGIDTHTAIKKLEAVGFWTEQIKSARIGTRFILAFMVVMLVPLFLRSFGLI